MAVYRRINRRAILALVVVTSVALITLDVRAWGPLETVQDGARTALSPIATVVDGVVSPVGDWATGVWDAGSLEDENARLERRIDDQRGAVARARAAASENEQLRALLDLPFVEDADAIAARVISGATGNFEWTVQLDRGTDDGVEEGMPVVTGAGLVGRVVGSSGGRATVLLIRDPASGVRVVTEDAGTSGIAQGRSGEATLRLDLFDPASEVREGELVFTEGPQASRFPPGVPVAEVVDVERRQGRLRQGVVLEPLVDLRSLEYVKVLRWPPA